MLPALCVDEKQVSGAYWKQLRGTGLETALFLLIGFLLI